MKWSAFFMLIHACLLAATLFGQRKPTTFEVPACRSYMQQHKTIAILPFYVLLDSNRYEAWDTSAFFRQRQEIVGFHYQSLVYKFLVVNNDRCPIGLQDIFTTNAKLAELQLAPEKLLHYNIQTLARQLNVDAVLYGIATAGKEDFLHHSGLDSLVHSMFPGKDKLEQNNFFLALIDKQRGLCWSMSALRDVLTGTINLQYLQPFLVTDVQLIPYWTGKKIRLF